MSQYPQQPQWQPTNPPVPAAQKGWFARHKVLSIVLGLSALLFVVCCGALAASMGGGSDSSTDSSAAKTSQSSDKQTATEEPTEESAETAEESEGAAPSSDKAEEPTQEMTTEQENAVRAAENYLDFMPFSKKGLIEQLSSPAGDNYSRDVAEFAVAHIESDVDWNEQAVKAAQNYLDLMAFSRSGLIEQLTSDAGDGYTREQAEYAADEVGL